MSSYHELSNETEFKQRHIGPSDEEIQAELKTLGLKNLDELIQATVPQNILKRESFLTHVSESESTMLTHAREFAAKNQVFKSYIGMGYYGTHSPNVILRNILENPGWYTAYTPYQAEIAQGRLEALLNFQTLITELTALPMANASLLDEGTAAAEAMHLCFSQSPKNSANAIFVSEDCHPQTIKVVRTRADALGLEVVVGDFEKMNFEEKFSPASSNILEAMVGFAITLNLLKNLTTTKFL